VYDHPGTWILQHSFHILLRFLSLSVYAKGASFTLGLTTVVYLSNVLYLQKSCNVEGVLLLQYDQDYMGNFKSNEALHFYSKENTFVNKINFQSSVIILPDDLHQFIHLLTGLHCCCVICISLLLQ